MVKAVLTHLTGGRQGLREEFAAGKLSLGRGPENTVPFYLRDTRVSAHHAEIWFDGRHFRIRDLDSTNGTFVNGQQVAESALRDGDIIDLGLGGARIRFEVEQEPEPAAHHKAAGAAPPPADEDRMVLPPPMAAAEEQPAPKQLGQTTVELLIDDALRRSKERQRVTLGLALVGVALLGSLLTVLLVRSGDRATDLAAIAERNQAAVVLIRCEYFVKDGNNNVLGERAADGTGFAVSADGLIVTNRHVVRGWEYDKDLRERNLTGQLKRLLVLFADHSQSEALPAEIYRVSQSPEADVAVVRVEQFRSLPVVKGLNSDLGQLRQGDPVALIGFPLGSQLLQLTGEQVARTTLTQGVISKVTANLLQVDARVQHGSSGGPVFNSRGEVVAILTSGLVEAGGGGINFATPIKFAAELLDNNR